jgi:perosamine synthetase
MESIAWSVPEVRDDELAEVVGSFQADWLTMGPKVKAFERVMADYLRVPHAVAVTNGSVAIDLALQVFGIGYGDEVIVPSLTYYATAAAVSRLGAVPVFVDVEAAAWNLDAARIEEAIGPRTKAILFIDYGGNPADVDAILAVGRRHGLEVIQDAAQSLGGIYKGSPLGAQTRVSTMSFHMAKVVTTVEGGMVFTHDERIANELRICRNQGESAKYLHSHLGTNARMTDLNAGIGLAQFRKLPWLLGERKRVADHYARRFAGCNRIATPICRHEDSAHSNFLYSIEVPDRDGVVAALREARIDTRICYPMPLYRQGLYANGRLPSRHYASPVSERVAANSVALPIFPALRPDQVDRIADIVLRAIQ